MQKPPLPKIVTPEINNRKRPSTPHMVPNNHPILDVIKQVKLSE